MAAGMVRARVTIRPLLTAEEMDKAVEKWPGCALARAVAKLRERQQRGRSALRFGG
jgi:hypothetical protein